MKLQKQSSFRVKQLNISINRNFLKKQVKKQTFAWKINLHLLQPIGKNYRLIGCSMLYSSSLEFSISHNILKVVVTLDVHEMIFENRLHRRYQNVDIKTYFRSKGFCMIYYTVMSLPKPDRDTTVVFRDKSNI